VILNERRRKKVCEFFFFFFFVEFFLFCNRLLLSDKAQVFPLSYRYEPKILYYIIIRFVSNINVKLLSINVNVKNCFHLQVRAKAISEISGGKWLSSSATSVDSMAF
jgi:hypothetical protein